MKLKFFHSVIHKKIYDYETLDTVVFPIIFLRRHSISLENTTQVYLPINLLRCNSCNPFSR